MNLRYTIFLSTLLILAPAMALSHGKKHDTESKAAFEREQQPWGIAAEEGAEITETVAVNMGDNMRFSPAEFNFSEGDTVKFVINNQGKLLHEFVIGTKEKNDEHAELMIKFPNMEHDEPHMAHVDPGEEGEIIWTFNKTGKFDFACLIAGHYQAGMVGSITVTSP